MCPQRLKTAIQKHFDEPSFDEEPKKLAYYLNHDYTEHGLKWGLLKGNDRINAMAILKVPKTLKLVSHLALVKICDTFNTTEYGEGEEYFKICEFQKSSNTFSYWVNESNKKTSV